jgi:ribosomal protein L37AE/L43A
MSKQIVNCQLCHKEMKAEYGERLWICNDCRVELARTLHWKILYSLYQQSLEKEYHDNLLLENG